MKRIWFSVLTVLACGGGDANPDAASSDSSGNTVIEVTPCEGETVTVESTGGFRFSPKDSTIAKDQIVKFVSGPGHDVAPSGAMSDEGLRVDFGATACLKFTKTGTFNFKCTPHGFLGSVTVN